MLQKKILIPGVVVLLLVLVGGYWVTFMSSRPAPKSEAELKRTEGPIYALPKEFVVNLAGQEQNFAKIGVAFRLSEYSADQLPAAEGSTEPGTFHVEEDPLIRDIVLAEIQKATFAQVRTRTGRTALKRRIKKRINRETGMFILDVYWTEFAVQ